MDETVKTAVNHWLSDPAIADADKREIRELIARGDEKELTDRFYRDLEFGTGGMRGLMGAGLNRMNVYTVGAAAQGLANYVARQGEGAKKAGVAIAYDCRRNSPVFARTTASVLAANGVTAYLFEQLRPTPELSFAVRHLKCTAGVVITASHNPPAYNGFKAYWSDGAGVVPPHDKNIIQEVRAVGAFANIRLTDVDQAIRSGMIRVLGREMDEAFLQAIDGSCLNPQLVHAQGKSLKIVYTALHGTGGTVTPEALGRRGFDNVLLVSEQMKPDGEFPTVASPNPEEGAALTMGIQLAQQSGAGLVIATDPDADRAGIAVRARNGEFQLVTGNQTAALLTWYICEHHRRAGTFPKNGAVVTTIVSSDLMKEIARSYGAEVHEVLTGFKWIGEKITQWEAEGSHGVPSRTYLFGAEESYGYMPCTYTRDKDAVTSTCYIADLAATLAAEGKTLYDLLEDLYRRYGYYQEYTLNVTLPGKEGADRIRGMMTSLREKPPAWIGGSRVTTIGDLSSGEIRDAATGQATGRYGLPASDVLVFTLEGGTKVIARPSGTEPKIKFYILVREPAGDLEAARLAAATRIETIRADVGRWAS